MPTATRATSTCCSSQRNRGGAVAQAQCHGPNGFTHHRLNDVKRVVLSGNPMRQQGIRADDGYLPIAKPDTAGILEDRLEGLEHAPSQIRDYGHADDMYASVGLNDMAEDERAICKIFMGNNVFCGPDSILGADLRTGDPAGGRETPLQQLARQPHAWRRPRCRRICDKL